MQIRRSPEKRRLSIAGICPIRSSIRDTEKNLAEQSSNRRRFEFVPVKYECAGDAFSMIDRAERRDRSVPTQDRCREASENRQR